MKQHVTEPTITTESQLRSESMEETTLAEAVANGRLFILNGRGEYEPVILACWWLDENPLQVCEHGYEFNLDGDETRRWKGEAQIHP